MDGLRLERRPFYMSSDTTVSLFKGFSETRNIPIILKRHNCTRLELAETVETMNLRLNEGLAQARVEHAHSCQLYELRVEITDNSYAVCHVLESLVTDVGKDIEMRKKAGRQYSETELRKFLLQAARALQFAHSKVSVTQKIAHRDIKPDNIFLDEAGNYKVGDFGCVWERKKGTVTMSAAGTPFFMCPQLRQACLGVDLSYNPYKADVFALGASALNLATLTPPQALCTMEKLDSVVQSELGRINYSLELKTILQGMLKAEEAPRLQMSRVIELLEGQQPERPIPAPAPQPLQGVEPVPVVKPGPRPAPAMVPQPKSSGGRAQEIGIIPYIIGESLMYYDLQTGIVSSANLTVSFGRFTQFCFLHDNALLCADMENLYILFLMEGTLTNVNSKTRRINMGIIKHEGFVYLFGGYGGSGFLKLCEKLAIAKQSWTKLQDMRYPKMNFKPCVFRDLIILVCCNPVSEGMIETFNPSRNEFKVLSTRLPPSLSGGGDSLTFVVDEELVIISKNNQMGKWRIDNQSDFAVSTISRDIYQHLCCSITVQKGKKILFFDGNRLWNINLKTLRVS